MIQDSREHMELRVNSLQVVIKSIIDNYEKRIFVDSYRKEESGIEDLSGAAARTGDFI